MKDDVLGQPRLPVRAARTVILLLSAMAAADSFVSVKKKYSLEDKKALAVLIDVKKC